MNRNIELRTPGNMQKSDIVGDYKTKMMTHHDGNIRELYYTNIETPFPEGKQIVSVSNTDGFITMANEVFIEMSGYTRQELMGMPHYILHHPDMPKAAFNDLWSSLKEQGSWQGYVKNLRKDGGYYWVHASIFALKRSGEVVGYTSNRTAATPEKIAECEKLYADMLSKQIAA